MTEPLVDDSGFPLNNIDVYQVRHARHEIICLQNDLKTLMKEIEKGIHEVHATATVESVNTDASTKMTQMQISDEVSNETELTPIVKVNLVCAGSPAEDAVICLFFSFVT